MNLLYSDIFKKIHTYLDSKSSARFLRVSRLTYLKNYSHKHPRIQINLDKHKIFLKFDDNCKWNEIKIKDLKKIKKVHHLELSVSYYHSIQIKILKYLKIISVYSFVFSNEDRNNRSNSCVILQFNTRNMPFVYTNELLSSFKYFTIEHLYLDIVCKPEINMKYHFPHLKTLILDYCSLPLINYDYIETIICIGTSINTGPNVYHFLSDPFRSYEINLRGKCPKIQVFVVRKSENISFKRYKKLIINFKYLEILEIPVGFSYDWISKLKTESKYFILHISVENLHTDIDPFIIELNKKFNTFLLITDVLYSNNLNDLKLKYPNFKFMRIQNSNFQIKLLITKGVFVEVTHEYLRLHGWREISFVPTVFGNMKNKLLQTLSTRFT